MKRLLGMRILGLVVLSFLLVVNCAENGTDPDPNILPNTVWGGFQINATPDEGTMYGVRAYWSGSDVDGAVYWYNWKVIGDADDNVYIFDIIRDDLGDSVGVDTTNLSEWQTTNAITMEMSLDFPTEDKTYIFSVRAQDNDLDFDDTPATEIIGLARGSENVPPITSIISGPPNGSTTGPGIYFLVGGNDPNGTVETIEYSIDGGAWVSVDAEFNTATIIIRGQTAGAKTIAFRAVDNYDLADPTPVSTSVVVNTTLAPELSLSVVDGQAFIVPYTDPQMEELVITATATVDFYYSFIDSFRVVTSAGDDFITSDIEYTFQNLPSGDYWIEVTAYDIGGNPTSTGHVNYSIVELAAGDGILCVNGVDWATYGGEAIDLWENGVPWGNRTHFKCWDLMGDATADSAFADSLLGSGSIPSWMLDTLFFDAVSWMWNEYSGDDDYWYESVGDIVNFLEMGGNVLIGGRYGEDIFIGDDACEAFADYCGYVGYTGGFSPTTAVAVHDSVTDISGASVAATSVIEVNHPDVIQLYETDGGVPGLGWVILPNGAGGGGAVCYIGGRNYRWDNTDLKENLDVIHRYFFGIAN